VSVFTRLVVGLGGAAPVRKLVGGTKPGRALASRFVAGETLVQALAAARRLNDRGVKVSLDFLGEEVRDPAEVQQAIAAYELCLDEIAAAAIDGNISVKLTQLGLAFDRQAATAGLDHLATAAGKYGLTITVDMEDSRYTAATVDIYEATQRRRGNLGLALQAYLYRTHEDLMRLIPLGGHLRLCKGAYVEKADVAYTTRDDVTAAFTRGLEILMSAPEVVPAVATHDLRLIELTRRLAARREGYFEFQMLYGVQPQIQQELVEQGFPLRVYVPYGSHWYPYLLRRLAERPANLGFFVRAVLSR
jgi:proline dehydrogenase